MLLALDVILLLDPVQQHFVCFVRGGHDSCLCTQFCCLAIRNSSPYKQYKLHSFRLYSGLSDGTGQASQHSQQIDFENVATEQLAQIS